MLLFALWGCDPLGSWPIGSDDNGLPEERVTATPGLLDFGEVSVNGLGAIVLDLTLSNLGEAEVTVTGHDEPIGDDNFSVAASPLLVVSPATSVTVAVTFAPESELEAVARLRISPGGDVVELRGVGRAPVLSFGDAELPATVLGCSGDGRVLVANEGSEPLALLDVTVDGAEFEVTGWPPEVPAAQTGAIDVRFTPGGSGDRGAVLTVGSNDPARAVAATTITALGYEGERVEESFRYSPTNPTDVIFAVQGDLVGNEDRLGPALTAWMDRVSADNADVHVTALASGDACPPGSPEWVDGSSSELATINVIDRAFHEPGGAWDRDLLGLAAAGLDRSGSGGCLDGFRREGADLDVAVIGVLPPDGDLADALAALDAEDQEAGGLRVNALVPIDGNCGDAGSAYAEVALATGGVAADFCDAVWTDAFTGFASFPNADTAVRYVLAEEPVATTIEVLVEGATWTAWSWDSADNSVVLDPSDPPPLGAEVTIRYVSAVACDG